MKLREYFEKRCVNISMFCETHNLSYKSIMNILQERHQPTLKVCLQIEKATDKEVKVSDLLIDEKSIKKKQKAKASKKSQ